MNDMYKTDPKMGENENGKGLKRTSISKCMAGRPQSELHITWLVFSQIALAPNPEIQFRS